MIRRIPNTWAQRVGTTQAIMSAAWRLLKLQKQLLLLPIASSACLLLLTAGWAIPAFFGMFSGPSSQDSVRLGDTSSSIGAFLFYVITYGVVIFFNAALASCVLRNLEGSLSQFLPACTMPRRSFRRSSAERCCPRQSA